MKTRSPIFNFIATIAFAALAFLGPKALATDSFVPIEAHDPLAKSVVRIELPGDWGSAGTCSGTFIRHDAILTETHCINGEERAHRIILGVTSRNSSEDIYLSTKIAYPRRFQKPDVAILFINPKPGESIEEFESKTIPLRRHNQANGMLFTTYPMQVIAFGYRDGEMRLRRNERIGVHNRWFSKIIKSVRTEQGFVVPGDSGGAAIVHGPAGWELWGTVWGIAEGEDYVVHVDSYSAWIDAALAANPAYQRPQR